jgi:hypothetical protein
VLYILSRLKKKKEDYPIKMNTHYDVEIAKNRIYVAGIFIIALSSLFVANTEAGSIQQINNEISCDDAKVTIISDCDKYEPLSYFPHCNRQNINIVKAGIDKTVKASGKLTSVRDGKGRIIGRWLGAVISEVACAKGDQKHYLLVGYYNGGNCEKCEWYELYDLNGIRLAGGNSRNEKKNFAATYKKIGMPQEWPSSLFKGINYKR